MKKKTVESIGASGKLPAVVGRGGSKSIEKEPEVRELAFLHPTTETDIVSSLHRMFEELVDFESHIASIAMVTNETPDSFSDGFHRLVTSLDWDIHEMSINVVRMAFELLDPADRREFQGETVESDAERFDLTRRAFYKKCTLGEEEGLRKLGLKRA